MRNLCHLRSRARRELMHYVLKGWVDVGGRSLRLSQGPPSLHMQVAEAALPCFCRHRLLMRADCVRPRPFIQRRISDQFCGFSTALLQSEGRSSGQKQQLLSTTQDGTRSDGWMYYSKKTSKTAKNKEKSPSVHLRYCSQNLCGPRRPSPHP